MERQVKECDCIKSFEAAREDLYHHPAQKLGSDDVLGSAVNAMDWAGERISTLENMLRSAGYNAEQIAAGTPYVEAMGT